MNTEDKIIDLHHEVYKLIFVTQELPLTIHDNYLLGYEVTPKKEIIFRTEYSEGDRSEFTDVIFSGIVAYQFTDDAFEGGSTIYAIDEIDLELFLAEQAGQFKNTYNDWIASENALQKLKDKGLHYYAISTSIGMHGWVLCKSYLLKKRV